MRILLAILLLVSFSFSEFIMNELRITISDIDETGAAKITENIRFIMKGDYEISVYDSAIKNNKLSVWASSIPLEDIKLHVDTSKVDIRDFRLRPQPKRNCNPFQNLCHGELILEYWAYPLYENGSVIEGTGLFSVEKYKPRTVRYTLNADALSFSPSEDTLLLKKYTYLTVEFPERSIILDLNPIPEEGVEVPLITDSLTWNNMVLVKFSLIFDVEQTIEEEVVSFFTGFLKYGAEFVNEDKNFPVIFLLIIIISSYIYIVSAKKRDVDVQRGR